MSYAWDFGDGNVGTGITTEHDFGANGTYTVALTVTDDRGGVSTSAQALRIGMPIVMAPAAGVTA